MESQRLFVALEIPAHVRNDLRETLEPWRVGLTDARWVPSENWHLTLLFLGATASDRLAWVRERLEVTAAAAGSFDTAFTASGGFPSATRARVVWAGLDDREGHIGALARAVGEALGAEPEDRPFTAHVTVARSDRSRPLPEAFTETPLPRTPFTVREMVLFCSHLGRPAPRYEPLARFAFGSPSSGAG